MGGGGGVGADLSASNEITEIDPGLGTGTGATDRIKSTATSEITWSATTADKAAARFERGIVAS